MKKISYLVILLLTSVVCCGHGQSLVFMSGIEKDLSSIEQTKILKDALPKAKITTFKHTEVNKLIKYSQSHPKETVILFSAAAKHTYRIAIETNAEIWVVEPHFSHSKSVREAIQIGLPKKQIILGPKESRGANISTGCQRTPKGLNHFQSLTYLCLLL